MKRIFSALVCAFFFCVFKTPSAEAIMAFEVAPQEVDRIVVVGLGAHVQLTHQPQATKLRVSGIDDTTESGNFVLDRKDRTLFIKMQEYSDKKEWSEALGRASKKKVLEFAGPSVPVEIHLREGQVSAQKWSKELKVFMTKGKVSSQGGSAALSIQLQNGDVTVQDQSSKLMADVYKGQVTVRQLRGDLEGSVFAGSLLVEKSKGVMQVSTAQATAKILQSTGALQFENVKGALLTQQFTGRIEGQTLDGAVNLGILPDTDVHVKSKTGKVSVNTVAGSGTLLNLRTADGEITVPSDLRVQKSAVEKSVRGRLSGKGDKGSIVIRSQEGSIVVK